LTTADRNSAYQYWVAETPGQSPLIINGGYLMRSASIANNTLLLRGDFNRTTTVEIMGVPRSVTSLAINNVTVKHQVDTDGNWRTQVAYTPPTITLPDPSALAWKYLDTLPELQPSYSDSAWPSADHKFTNNTYLQAPLTPTSLYASDYGFHAGGALLFQGYFAATGAETAFWLVTQGGCAFASLVWLNDTFLGSWAGESPNINGNGSTTGSSSHHRDSFPLRLTPGSRYVLTVLVDNMGNAQNALVGGDDMKAPRGIMSYGFAMSAGDPPAVEWKVTGNLGGEDYVDKVRGPLNEGGLFVERKGYHQPGAPADSFTAGGSPMEGIDEPGVGFWTAELKLDIPKEQWYVFFFSFSTSGLL
jgi:hypothetical protein